MVRTTLALTVVLCLINVGISTAAEAKLTAKGVEFFESKIRPVLVQHCYKCHAGSLKEPKGGLVLDSREGLAKGGESGAVIVPGEPKESLLVQALKFETYEMPPGNQLPDNVIADFEKWIEMGAPDPRSKSDAKKPSLVDARKFWSFQPLKKTAPPSIQNEAWPRTTIDRYLLAEMETKQLQVVPDADKYTLIRRASYDLTGLPPTPEQIQAFLNDPSPNAFEKVIDRLLASPQYGERWGRHWLDVARYGESTGKERNVPFQYAWRYRDYVIASFNADKPQDEFIREQIAGDLLPAKTAAERNEHLVATGFLALGTKSLNERKPEQFRADVADEQIDVTFRAVLGMTLACARCHDHKFDPFNQADYYTVAGVFRSTEVFCGVSPGNNMRGYEGKFAYLAPEKTTANQKPSAEDLKKIQELRSELLELHDKLAKGQALLSGGLEMKNGKKPDKKDLSERAEKLRTQLSKGRERAEEIVGQIKRLENKEPEGNQPVIAVRDAFVPRNAHIHIRGEVDQIGAEVPRGIPLVLAVGRPQKFETDQSGRLQLAMWLTSKDNALAARVMVNRIWSHLFGRGIVESIDNFGSLGDEPTHPALLDHLASRMIALDWSQKKFIKEIMLSRAYQLSSVHNEHNFGIDPDNRYVWRMPRRRLEAEAIRDGMLAMSGKLQLDPPHGSQVSKLPASEIGRGRSFFLFNDNGTLRSVYLPMVRSMVPDTLAVFDMADPSLPVAQREVTTVPTQALYMMNNEFVLRCSEAIAQRLLAEVPSDDNYRVEHLYLTCLNRPPTASERNHTQQYLQQFEGAVGFKISDEKARREAIWTSLAQTLLATGEFRYIY
jgi:cytochrome c553